QARGEFGTLGVISVRAKRSDGPRHVRRIGTFAGTPSAELLEPSVLHGGTAKRLRERLLVELRPSARARERTDICKHCDSMHQQQFEEALERMRRMAESEKRMRLVRHSKSVPATRGALVRRLCSLNFAARYGRADSRRTSSQLRKERPRPRNGKGARGPRAVRRTIRPRH